MLAFTPSIFPSLRVKWQDKVQCVCVHACALVSLDLEMHCQDNLNFIYMHIYILVIYTPIASSVGGKVRLVFSSVQKPSF